MTVQYTATAKSLSLRLALAAALGACAALACGCNDAASTAGQRTATASEVASDNRTDAPSATSPNSAAQPGAAHASRAPQSAAEVLDRMVAAYRSAQTYQDTGQVRVSFDHPDGRPYADGADFSVAFERPNKLRMHLYQAIVVSDGEKKRATVGDLPGQVLELNAPAEMSRDALYLDPILASVLTQGIAGESIQLALLLLDHPLEPILEGAREPVLLAPEKLDGDTCYRVEIRRNDGAVMLWVDEKDYTLRRISLPTDELTKALRSTQGEVRNVAVTIDFAAAQLNQPIAPEAFKFDLPEGSSVVKRFMPPPAAPPALLGKPIGEFSFTRLDGSPVTRESLAGKVVVVDFWATWCVWCFEGLPNLQKVFDSYQGNDKVAILAVNTDDASVTQQQIEESFAKAKVTIPIVRDTQEFAGKTFEVRGLPTMYILGPDGVVQAIEVGYNPNLAVELPKKIDELLAGKNLYEDELKRYEDEQRQFNESLSSSKAPAAETKAPSDPPSVPARTKPQSLSLAPLWTNDKLAQTGNILVVDDGQGDSRVILHDSHDSIVELGADGQPSARFELDIPPGCALTFLRTAVDGSGKRYFAASSPTQTHAFVFDENWQRQLMFPTAGQNPGISDVRLTDLDGDGTLELSVGYLGAVGLQNVTLAGERRWSNSALDDVFCLTFTDADENGHRDLLAANSKGTLVPVNAEGVEGVPLVLDGRFIRWVESADLDGDGAQEYCCIATKGAGQDLAIGLDSAGQEVWSYPLPSGSQPVTTLEPIAVGRLLGNASPVWVVAAADSSLHVLDGAGKLIDKFNYGQPITGLAVAQVGGKPALVVATKGAVEAWQVETPPTE